MNSSDQKPVLEIKNLSYSFGPNKAINGIKLKIFPGEFRVLLGPNGAGKTTLFSLLTGLLRPQKGQILIFDDNIEDCSQTVLTKIGVVFQQPTLDLDLTVLQNLHYHASLHGFKRVNAINRIEEELQRLGMVTKKNDRVRNLNSGHRRRVEIARALLHKPLLLLLDEPTVGLDMPTRRDIVNHVHHLAHDGEIAVLWATHLIDEVEKNDSVIILSHGSVLADGSANQVVAKSGANSISSAFEKLIEGSNQ